MVSGDVAFSGAADEYKHAIEWLQTLSVNGGVKVRRTAGQKCSAQPLSTPPDAGCQLRKLLFNSLARLASLPESLAC
jgi:hypothetical protein